MSQAPAAGILRGGRLLLLVLALTDLPGASFADSLRESLHWAGPYQGLLPCADCAGIVTLLELTEDGHYRLNERYERRSETPVVQSGAFVWDDTGAVIALDGFDPPRRYKLGQGKLWALDLAGQVIGGDLADMYILTSAD